MLYRWEKQIEAGGVYREQLLDISNFTYSKFCEAKKNSRQIVTLDLRRIALQRAREVGCSRFKASERWATNFKLKHNIVSRKITKFVSKKDVVEKEKIKDAALDFVLGAQPIIQKLGADCVVNADQSGFEFELHAGRTLDNKGVKKVEVIVQSKKSLTHSYTIMPTMTASGILKEPLYLVLREPNGKLFYYLTSVLETKCF